jgi:hypothetical protein
MGSQTCDFFLLKLWFSSPLLWSCPWRGFWTGLFRGPRKLPWQNPWWICMHEADQHGDLGSYVCRLAGEEDDDRGIGLIRELHF